MHTGRSDSARSEPIPQSFHGAAVIVLELGPGCHRQPPARIDDDVHITATKGPDVGSEQLSNSPLGPVAVYGMADPAGCRDAKPWPGGVDGVAPQRKNHQEPSSGSDALVINSLIFCTAPQPCRW